MAAGATGRNGPSLSSTSSAVNSTLCSNAAVPRQQRFGLDHQDGPAVTAERAGERGEDRAGERGEDRAGERGEDRAGERGEDRAGERGEDRAGERGEERAGERGED